MTLHDKLIARLRARVESDALKRGAPFATGRQIPTLEEFVASAPMAPESARQVWEMTFGGARRGRGNSPRMKRRRSGSA